MLCSRTAVLMVQKETKGAHHALCARYARAVWKIGYFGPISPNGQADKVTAVFPYTGLRRFLISPKFQILS